MKYILTQFNFWNLCQYFSRDENEFVYKKAPKRVVDFLKENDIKITQEKEKPEDAVLVQGTYLEWPASKELKPEILIRKFHIDDENYYAVMGSLKNGDELIYTELTKKLPEGIKATCYKDNKSEAPKERIIISKPRKGTLSLNNDIQEGAEVLHYVGKIVSTVKYRRFRLNELLKEKYKVSTVYSGYEDWYLEGIKYVIVSDPRDSIELCVNARARNIPVYYDRTDNWSALYIGSEEWLKDFANKITVSSAYLKNIREDAVLIENGYEKWEGTIPLTKSNIAVYVGKSSNKTDDEWMQKLIKANPDWQFISVGAKVEGTIHVSFLPWNEMMKFISSAKIGLIPLKADEYFKGQFNLKVWDYLQAGLYVIGHNTENMSHLKNFEEVGEDIPDLNEYEFDDCGLPEDEEWSRVLNRILTCYNLKEKQ